MSRSEYVVQFAKGDSVGSSILKLATEARHGRAPDWMLSVLILSCLGVLRFQSSRFDRSGARTIDMLSDEILLPKRGNDD